MLYNDAFIVEYSERIQNFQENILDYLIPAYLPLPERPMECINHLDKLLGNNK